MAAVWFALAACSGDDVPSTGAGTPTAGSSSAMDPSTAAGTGTAAPAAGTGAATGMPSAGSSPPTAAGTGGTSALPKPAGASAAGSSGNAGAVAAAGTGTMTTAGAMAAAGSGGASGAAGMAGMDAPPPAREPATSRALAITKEKHTEAPTFNVTRPMDLNATGAPLPVIVWANGGCFRSDFTWTPLFERWAKGGFVVLHLTGAGADDDIASMLQSTTKNEHAALIDWVVAQNKSGPYAGRLDVERIVVAGNSCGGVTALQVAAEKTPLAAVFVLSGSSALGSTDTAVMKAIKVPVGFIVGGSEDIAGANAKGDYAAMNDGIPAMVVNRRTGDHVTVSTDTMVLPEVAEIALNWMDLAVFGTKQAFDALDSPNHCEKCTPGDWMLTAKNLEKLQK
ncbi:MAG TPA: hypothetical protein VJR89_11845 [Polyangiales bacterium]|nr:hypothetical protein [Polyangiales bacterium]